MSGKEKHVSDTSRANSGRASAAVSRHGGWTNWTWSRSSQRRTVAASAQVETFLSE